MQAPLPGLRCPRNLLIINPTLQAGASFQEDNDYLQENGQKRVWRLIYEVVKKEGKKERKKKRVLKEERGTCSKAKAKTWCFRYIYCSFVGLSSLKEAGGLGGILGTTAGDTGVRLSSGAFPIRVWTGEGPWSPSLLQCSNRTPHTAFMLQTWAGDTPRGELGCPGPSGGFQSGAASLTQMLVFSNGGDDVA